MEISSKDYSVTKIDLMNVINIMNNSRNIEDITSAFLTLNLFEDEIGYHKELNDIRGEYNRLYNNDSVISAKNNIIHINTIYDKNLVKKREYYLKIFRDNLKVIDNNLRDEVYKYKKLSDYEIYNLLCNYFKSNDVEMLEKFNKYIDNKTILNITFPFYSGLTIASPIFNNIYIEVYRYHNFFDAMIILHELNHARFYETYFKNCRNSDYNLMVCTNPYVEVYPKLQERKFLQYLLDNNLYNQDVKKYVIEELKYIKELLIKNIDKFKKEIPVSFLDLKNINGFLYSNILSQYNFNPSDIEMILDDDFYLNRFNIDEIETANNLELKKLLNMR